ncbi:asparagine synthase-related protein [Clostridium oryzae]|uniref:asparagine synthase (glutamine-hydrolyzing) n=1 Tax=Clostridium oryzae TaxID=1450648 RepID=A0A1V4ISC8_9CLOT|nr:asparagine synthase-related protein [Clostridium oryzae]OPJ62715.1 asparagine synthetase 1 [Clostridium oryzae]
MGTIFGIYSADNQVNKEYCMNMLERIKTYSFDKLQAWQREKIFLGCGIQYDTPESCLEEMPQRYEASGLSITADAIIDNRQQLLEQFQIPKNLWNETTDSRLILLAYEKWQEDSPKYLVGDFSFAIWDEKKQQLFCARDHVGKRTLYYYHVNNTFAFSTIINPLLTITDMRLNERWLTDYLAVDGILHVTECNETPYEDIFQLPPAYAMIVSSKGIIKNHYWKPLENIKELKLNSDEEYDKAFREVFFEAVNCRLRSFKGVGIMLSGGLDSSSIACVAARKLADKNEILKGYSSIPIKEYENSLSKYYIPNESEYIKSISDDYDNILVNYCRNEDMNSYTNIDEFINILEQPYKTFQNLFWYNSFAEKAYEEGCRVLLNGQSGNSTISYGDFIVHAKTLFNKGKFITLRREIDALSKKVKMPKRKIEKIILKVVIPYNIRKIISSKIKHRNYDKFSSVMVSKNMIKKWNVGQRFDMEGYNQPIERYYDLYQNHKYIVDQLAFSHIGTIETRISLANKIAIRDPSRDKRVIEFCLSLPSEQFVRNGEQRLLIRRALKGIIPDKIRLNTARRGIQSADWVQRLKPYWKNIRKELECLVSDDGLIKKYIDIGKVQEALKQIDEVLDEENEESLRRLFIVLIFYKFLKAYERG